MTQYSGKVIRKTPVTPTQQSASGVWKLNEQAAAIRNNSWPVPGVPDPISRSVRLRSSASAYFNRTSVASPTNNKIFTISQWVKRGTINDPSVFENLFGGASSQQDTYGFGSGTNNAGDSIQLRDANVGSYNLLTTQVFRDPSSWYHLVLAVDTTQATAANRVKLYVNGTQVTSFSTATYPSQNYVFEWNAGSTASVIGRRSSGTASWYFDGYLTEVNFIDGQSLTPSSFGTTDTATGAWIPMPYTGTYGANGFYLNFKDNTSTTTIGYDYSGNSNNWTANNISLTAGTTYDSMLDVPTPWVGYSTTTDTSAVTRGNYCTLNPLDQTAVTISDANLQAYSGTTTANVRGTFAVSSGKWYWEVTAGTFATANTHMIGVCDATVAITSSSWGTANCWSYYASNGNKYNAGANSAYGATYTSGDVIGIALDMDNGTLTFYKNGVSQGTAYTGLTGKTLTSSFGTALYTLYCQYNFGQRPFSYSVPSGFKTFVTTNLTTPTIANGANYMAATTYTGTGATLSVTNTVNGVSFKPDFVWIKQRSGTAQNHALVDAVRGVGLQLSSSLTDAEINGSAAVTALNSNGFTLGNNSNGYNVNANTQTYIGWQWQAGQGTTSSNTAGSITSTVSVNTTAGFSIVTYTGTGANATVGHGLGVAPRMVIVKNRSVASGWRVYHVGLTSAAYVVYLNATNAQTLEAIAFNSTAPTSSVFSVGASGDTNGSGNLEVAYCWAAVAGFSAFGSYTGNGSTDGPFIYCGFRPRFILQKRTDTTSDWRIHDTSRATYNADTIALMPNLSNAEDTGSNIIDELSNGFKCRDAGAFNISGGTYIYAAFAENPFKYSNAR